MLGISNRIGVNIKLETQYLFLGSKLPSLVTKWSYKLKAAIVQHVVETFYFLFWDSVLLGQYFRLDHACGVLSAADRSEV